MKKTGLFKILLCLLVVVAIGSWFINLTYFSQGELIPLPEQYQASIGIFDIFQITFATVSYFSDKLIFLLSVGAFYGVLAKTGKYRAWVDKIAETFKGREKTFVIVTMIILAILSSIFNYGMLFFIFIPFLIGIIITMGYEKIVAFVSTFGAIIIGELGSTFGNNVTVTLNEVLGTTLTTGIVYRIALLLLGLLCLTVFVLKSKVNRKENAKDLDIVVGEKNSNKYSVVHLFVIFGLLFALLVIGFSVWPNYFKTDIFSSLHNSIVTAKIGGKEFFGNLFGYYFNTVYQQTGALAIGVLGSWTYFEMSIIMLLASLLVGRLYKMKHKDILDYMIGGAKKLLVPALLVVFAYTILLASQYLYPTVANFILSATKNFNIFFSSVAMTLSSIFSVDTPYILYNAPQIAATGGNTTIVMLLTQGIYGISMLLVPTSTMLILGLSYLEIPYKEYLKKVWKYFLSLLAILLLWIILLAVILK